MGRGGGTKIRADVGQTDLPYVSWAGLRYRRLVKGVYAGLFFVLRLGRTGDAISPSIAQQGPANERSGDGMMLPFMGVNVARSYLDMAEADVHAKLTQLCLT
ncbi:uncharacterized protein KRP23_13850 [Phytophthora ramorum]|uniref:uncharacterized protein n=1 Tax=Phytophthora ramorum TaxID=164328 RepID=UPI0030A090EA|nr:hypothetical protein KRP23_13850 [Phytophthora ramorum]